MGWDFSELCKVPRVVPCSKGCAKNTHQWKSPACPAEATGGFPGWFREKALTPLPPKWCWVTIHHEVLVVQQREMEWSGIDSLLQGLAYVTCQLMPHSKPNDEIQSEVWWHTGRLGHGSQYERYHLDCHHSSGQLTEEYNFEIIF